MGAGERWEQESGCADEQMSSGGRTQQLCLEDLSGAVRLLFSMLGCLDVLICVHMRLFSNN